MIDGLEIWRVILLVLIMGGLGFAWWKLNAGKINFAKAFDPKSRRIQVLETRWLGARSMIYLVEVDQQHFLLSTSGQHSSWQPLNETHEKIPAREKSMESEKTVGGKSS